MERFRVLHRDISRAKRDGAMLADTGIGAFIRGPVRDGIGAARSVRKSRAP
jgi:hypothetical protein